MVPERGSLAVTKFLILRDVLFSMPVASGTGKEDHLFCVENDSSLCLLP